MRMLLLALLLCCCASRGRNPALVVMNNAPDATYQGTGCVIRRVPEGDYVLTAGHVLDHGGPTLSGYSVSGRAATFVSSYVGDTVEGWCDLGIVFVGVHLDAPVLEIGTRSEADVGHIGTLHGWRTLRADGTALTSKPPVIAGDSGSPVLQYGKLVGVVWGAANDNVEITESNVIRTFTHR